VKRHGVSILVESGAMIRFGIKSLIFVTAVVAAYGLIIHAARHGHNVTCLFALVLYIALIGIGVVRAENAHKKREEFAGSQAKSQSRED